MNLKTLACIAVLALFVTLFCNVRNEMDYAKGTAEFSARTNPIGFGYQG